MDEKYVSFTTPVKRVCWRRSFTRSAKLVSLISVACGIVMAILMMSLGWAHNSQGEFHMDDHVDWTYWLWIGFTWLLATTVAMLLPTFVVTFVLAVVRKRIAARWSELSPVPDRLPGVTYEQPDNYQIERT